MATISDPQLLRTALFVLWKHRLKAAAAALLVVAVTGVALLLVPRTYQATARLFVGDGREHVALAPEAAKDTAFRTKEEVINSEVAILSSAYLHRKTIERLGPDVFKMPLVPPRTIFGRLRVAVSDAQTAAVEWARGLVVRLALMDAPRPFDEALATLEKGLSAGLMRKANVIEVTMRSRNPQAASRVLDTLIELYLERHNEVHRTPGAYEFLQAETTRVQRRLADAEDRFQDFRTKEGLVSLEDQKRLLVTQVHEVTTSLERTQRELAETTARVQRIRGDMGTISETVTLSEIRQRNPVLDTIESRLVELQLQREKLGARFLSDARSVQDVDREIERLRELQAKSRAEQVSSVTAGQNTTYKELERLALADEARLVALRAGEAAQRQALADYQNRLASLASKEMALTRLAQDMAVNQSDYEAYRKGLQSRRIDAEMDRQRIVRVTVIEPPTVPTTPVGVNMLLALSVSTLVGLMLGSSVAWIAEVYDRTVWREEDVEERFGLPVLASLPEVRGYHAPDLGTLDARSEPMSRLRTEQTDVPLALLPGYRRLLGRLLSDPRNLRVVALTGAEPGVGVTSTIVALGAVLADEFAVDVVLVDADFRSPVLGGGGDGQVPGLAEVIAETARLDDVTLKTARTRLSVLPAGSAHAGALRLLESAGFDRCLEELKLRYRLVLVRTAPVTTAPETRQVAARVDGLGLVVQAERTPRDAVADAITLLEPVRDRLLGIILNRARPIPRVLTGTTTRS